MLESPKTTVPSWLVERLLSIGELPAIVSQLKTAVYESADARNEAARVIGGDRDLASRLITLANASGENGRTASSVSEAIAIIGPDKAFAVSLALAVFDLFGVSGRLLDMRLHWRHAVAVAAAAHLIARKTGFCSADGAFLAGILHDVGRAALDKCAPREFAEALESLSRPGIIITAAEREKIGIDHAGAGEFILRRWKCPERMCRAVGLHHAKGLNDGSGAGAGTLAAVIQAADFAAWSNGLGGLEAAPKVVAAETCQRILAGLDQHELFEAMLGELDASGPLFGTAAPDADELRRSLSLAAEELGRVRNSHRDLQGQLSQKVREVEAADLMRRRVRHAKKIEEVRDSLLDCICRGLVIDRVAFFAVDGASGKIHGVAARSVTAAKTDVSGVSLSAPAANGSLARAIEAGRAVLVSTPDGAGGLLAAMGVSEGVVAPVVTGKRVIGLVFADNALSKRKLNAEDARSVSVLVQEAVLALENLVLLKEANRMKTIAETDALTGLHNRRLLMHLLANEVNRAARYQMPLSLVMIDLEGFKSFNDTYGHRAGDTVLKSFGRLLKQCSRTIDIPGRLGGDEFLVILPETTLDAAGLYAQRVRKLTETLAVRLRERFSDCTFTISIGMTSFNKESDDPDSFLHRADQAMYAAKQRGRNRVCAL